MVDNELIKIGIALDYPINWTIETVMRELVQNFYDAIGEERFGKDFKINVRRNKEFVDVVMETKGNSFSYEWLNYVGGSTKTDHPGKYVGMYGEGFKMCMLSLENLGCRMCRMESQNWTITPWTGFPASSFTMTRYWSTDPSEPDAGAASFPPPSPGNRSILRISTPTANSASRRDGMRTGQTG